MRTKRKCRLCTCLIFACAITMGMPVIPVVNAEDSVESLENATSGLQSELNGLNSELASLSSELDSTLEKLNSTTAQVEQTKIDLANAKAEEESQYEAMKKRIKYMYEEGNTSMLELILSAKSMADFLNKADFVTSISEYDRNMLDQLHAVQEQVAQKEADLQAEQASLTNLKNDLDVKEQALTNKISSTSSELSQYSDQLARAKAAAAAAQEALNRQVQVQQAQEALNAQQAAQAQQQAQQQAAAQPPNTNDNTTNIPEVTTPPDNSEASSGSTVDVSATELDEMAAILECEAGSSDYDALLAVGAVIMNRVNSSSYPNSIHAVIHQSGQFSPVASGKFQRVLNRGAASICYEAARDAIAGKNNIGDCLQFRMIGTSHQGITIGDNVFF